MTRTLQHIALIILATTLLLPLFMQQSLAQDFTDESMMGLQLAQTRLDSTLETLREIRADQIPTQNNLCTTACAPGTNAQGEALNYCVRSCNDGSRETFVGSLEIARY